MANLAQGQGGSDVTVPDVNQSAHGQSEFSDVNKTRLETFVARGEKIIDNFAAGMEGFKAMAKRFKVVEDAIDTLQKNSGKRQQEPMPGSSSSKK